MTHTTDPRALVEQLVAALEKHGKAPGDWACAECRPHSDMLKAGFQCSYHAALTAANEYIKQPETHPHEFRCPVCFDDPSNLKQPQAQGECDSPELCKLNRACAGQLGTKKQCATHPQATEPALADHPDVRELRKWLNEGQTSEIDRKTLARVLAMFTQATEPAPHCARCGSSTGQACNDMGCGYLEAGNGEPAPCTSWSGDPSTQDYASTQPAPSKQGCELGCKTECAAKRDGCASECPALPWQPAPSTAGDESNTARGKGCRCKLAKGQWFTMCGETDMGQGAPALCTECGGTFMRTDATQPAQGERAEVIAELLEAVKFGGTRSLFQRAAALLQSAPSQTQRALDYCTECMRPKQADGTCSHGIGGQQ